MTTCQKTIHTGCIGLVVLLASIGAAVSQTFPQRDQREQQRLTDQLRQQRELSQQRLGDDLRGRLQQQEQQHQRIQLEDRIRRQQIQDQLDRAKR